MYSKGVAQGTGAGVLLADKRAGKDVQDNLIDHNGGVIAMGYCIYDAASDDGRHTEKNQGPQSPADTHLAPHLVK
jgi:uncharacterized membrane protein YebE (DUF533 family)